MKTILKTLGFLLLSSVLFVACKSTDPLVKQRQIEELDHKVLSTNYTFNATRANPSSGRSVNLTSTYTLKVSKDTVQAFLPYFGRAYTAPSPGEEGGVKFTSTNFTYQVSDKRKGTYTVTINTKDTPNNYQLSLLIGETGSATLYVTQRSKQGITFFGNIE